VNNDIYMVYIMGGDRSLPGSIGGAMVLKGKAKKAYQREYMRNYRLKKQVVRPLEINPVQPEYIERPAMIMPKPIYMKSKTTTNATDYVVIPEIDADGNAIYEEG